MKKTCISKGPIAWLTSDANHTHLAFSNTTPHLHGHSRSLVTDESDFNLSVLCNLEKDPSIIDILNSKDNKI